MTGYNPGPRVEEVERLKVEDVELRPKSGVLHFRQGKGFKERDVPLPKSARDPLEAWLKEREKLGVPHEDHIMLWKFQSTATQRLDSVAAPGPARLLLNYYTFLAECVVRKWRSRCPPRGVVSRLPLFVY